MSILHDPFPGISQPQVVELKFWGFRRDSSVAVSARLMECENGQQTDFTNFLHRKKFNWKVTNLLSKTGRYISPVTYVISNRLALIICHSEKSCLTHPRGQYVFSSY